MLLGPRENGKRWRGWEGANESGVGSNLNVVIVDG